MKATDYRYRSEKTRFDLAMRMIGHEARTGTIRYWTGLSDDRIRKLYLSYFKYSGQPVRRRRGRSPSQVTPLIKTPRRTLESGVFANLLITNGLLYPRDGDPVDWRGNIDLGHRFCECYETHKTLVPRTKLSFEWAWNLLTSMQRGDELGFAHCTVCSTRYIFDVLALPKSLCPACATFAVHGQSAGAN